MIYNKPDTIYARAATRFKASADAILSSIKKAVDEFKEEVDENTGILCREVPSGLFDFPACDVPQKHPGISTEESTPQTSPKDRKTNASRPSPMVVASGSLVTSLTFFIWIGISWLHAAGL